MSLLASAGELAEVREPNCSSTLHATPNRMVRQRSIRS